MSHCTKFDFQYTNEKFIRNSFEDLGLKCRTDRVYSYASSYDKEIGNYKSVRNALVAERNGFNYFMENYGTHYELSIEKHNMTYSEQNISQSMAEEFRKTYIMEVAKDVVEKMNAKGENALLEETDAGYEIKFGLIYDKSILIKFDNGRVIEEVHGVKGKNCVSLTEAIENMMSSPEVELESEWTSEYYEEPDNGLTIYNMEQM